LTRVADVTRQVGIGVHHFHRPAAEDVARAHDQRIADLAGQGQRLRRRSRAVAVRAVVSSRPRLSTSFWKRSRSSARSIESGEVPITGTPLASSACASFSGVCPPYCTITPSGFSSSTISSTSSSVSDSKYRRSEVS